jgi:ATP-dependent DNA helicase PIF1
MDFSNEQKNAFDKYVNGDNVFVTGPGGSGKSMLITKIYQHALKNNKEIQVTALTGCATILLNCCAKTIHSWAGIGLGNACLETYIDKIHRTKNVKGAWQKIDVLIVDEVSMLSQKLFELLNNIGKIIRRNPKPFGGIQLIFCGDFYQLPPVGNFDEVESRQFCFESMEWDKVFPLKNQIEFIKIFRQSDPEYIDILNQIREGKIKQKTNVLLSQLVGREKDVSLIIEPTKIYPLRSKVDSLNYKKMGDLTGDVYTYEMVSQTGLEIIGKDVEIKKKFSNLDIEMELKSMSNNLMCDSTIQLKVGAQVMCIINILRLEGDLELCNGSQGIVESICKISGFPIIQFNNGIKRTMIVHTWKSDKIPGIGISQIPLILAWAITIHKSQGSSMDVADIDIGKDIFENGQSYVALSRVKSLKGLYLSGYNSSKIFVHKKAREFYERLHEYQRSKIEE